MKIKFLFLVTFLLAVVLDINAQSFKVASFNIRYDNPRDSGNLWVKPCACCSQSYPLS